MRLLFSILKNKNASCPDTVDYQVSDAPHAVDGWENTHPLTCRLIYWRPPTITQVIGKTNRRISELL